jgi:uncharacterized protein YgiM (DUF1202 family)
MSLLSRKSPRLVVVALIVLGFGSSAGAEDIYVKKAEVTLRQGKAAYSKKVATFGKGERLTVEERAAGGWLKVSGPGGATGWVHDTALSRQPVKREAAAGGFADAGARAGAGTLSGRQIGDFVDENNVHISGEGWEVTPYQTRNKLNPAGLRQMKSAKDKALASIESFVAEGNVGAGATE